MKGLGRRLLTCLSMVLLICSMSIGASATEVSDDVVVTDNVIEIEEINDTSVVENEVETGCFDDVLPGSYYYEAVEYIAAEGITSGVSERVYAPDALISVREWCVMTCRALDITQALERAATEEFFGQACSNECYWNGWIPMEAVIDPTQNMCRGAFYEAAFKSFGLTLYDAKLYEGVAAVSSWENAVRVAAELGICEKDADCREIVTRGEAAYVMWCLLTNEYEIEEPPLIGEFPIENPGDLWLGLYLSELMEVPQAIRDDFQRLGWTYIVDYDYMEDYSERHGDNYIGLCSSGAKTIHVSDCSATMHEFGHFLDAIQGWHSRKFWDEHEAADAFMRDYAMTDAAEYYADYFVYFLEWQHVEWRVEQMKELTPKTYAHFVELQEKGWDVK